MELDDETLNKKEERYAASAALLANGLCERESILPPRHLTRQIVGDGQDAAAALAGFVATHWDLAAETLRSQGYIALIKLSGALKDRLDFLSDALDAREQQQALEEGPGDYVALRRIVASDAGRYGESKTLRGSLKSQTAPSKAWSWTLDRRGSGDFYVVSVKASEKLLTLTLDLPVEERSFKASQTWGDVLDIVTDRLYKRTQPSADSIRTQNRWETIKFRSDVVCGVLDEFEATGYVRPFSTETWTSPTTEAFVHAERLSDPNYLLAQIAEKIRGSQMSIGQSLKGIRAEAESKVGPVVLAYQNATGGARRDLKDHEKAIRAALDYRKVSVTSMREKGAGALTA